MTKKIAIFNSSDATLHLLQMLFEDAGFEVVLGYVNDLTPEGTHDFLSANSPDLVLFDIAPPYSHNLGALQDFSRMAGPIPIVVTTTAEDRPEFAELPYPTLAKPYNPDDLLDLVQRSLAEGGQS